MCVLIMCQHVRRAATCSRVTNSPMEPIFSLDELLAPLRLVLVCLVAFALLVLGAHVAHLPSQRASSPARLARQQESNVLRCPLHLRPCPSPPLAACLGRLQVLQRGLYYVRNKQLHKALEEVATLEGSASALGPRSRRRGGGRPSKGAPPRRQAGRAPT